MLLVRKERFQYTIIQNTIIGYESQFFNVDIFITTLLTRISKKEVTTVASWKC